MPIKLLPAAFLAFPQAWEEPSQWHLLAAVADQGSPLPFDSGKSEKGDHWRLIRTENNTLYITVFLPFGKTTYCPFQ